MDAMFILNLHNKFSSQICGHVFLIHTADSLLVTNGGSVYCFKIVLNKQYPI
jgi:hypothetical protein